MESQPASKGFIKGRYAAATKLQSYGRKFAARLIYKERLREVRRQKRLELRRSRELELRLKAREDLERRKLEAAELEKRKLHAFTNWERRKKEEGARRKAKLHAEFLEGGVFLCAQTNRKWEHRLARYEASLSREREEREAAHAILLARLQERELSSKKARQPQPRPTVPPPRPLPNHDLLLDLIKKQQADKLQPPATPHMLDLMRPFSTHISGHVS